jgi:hypothetical protein
LRGVLTRRPLVEAQTQSAALSALILLPFSSLRHGLLADVIALVNDRRLGIGVKHPSYATLGGAILPVVAHLLYRLSCMLPSVVLTGAGSPLPFSHEVLVGRPALSVTAPCACNDIPDPSEAAQTADQHRVLSALPLIPPTSRIQSNKHCHRRALGRLKTHPA